MAQFPYSEELEERLTFVSKYGDEVKMTVRDGGLLLVPRRLAPIGVHDDRVLNPIPAINCKVPPRSEEQASCIAQSIKLLQAGVNHVLEAPTGWGKTYGGSAVAVGLAQTTLIIVPKNDLMDEWRNTLLNLIGVPPERIGHIQQDKCDYEGKWFTLAMVHSLVISDKYGPEMRKYFGTVLFDETHKMAAETFQRAAQMFPAMYRLGLSATPNRDDGKDPVIEANIGEVMVRGKEVPMSPKVLVKRTGWKIPRFKKWDPDKKEWKMEMIPHSPGRMATVYKAMRKNEIRNGIICEFVAQAYQKGRRTVIMADTLEHLKVLQVMLGKYKVPGEDVGFYVGGMSKEALKSNANRRIVCATYAMTAEGTNYPIWDTLVMATPRSNVKQAIGRVMRWMEGKTQPIIFDLLDDDSIFYAFYNGREVQYYQVKGTVVKL